MMIKCHSKNNLCSWNFIPTAQDFKNKVESTSVVGQLVGQLLSIMLLFIHVSVPNNLTLNLPAA